VYECHFHCAPMAVKIITLDDDTQAVDPQTLLRFKCARAARACCAAARRSRPARLRPARACARVARPAPAPVPACSAAGRVSPILPSTLTGGPVLRRARRQEVDLQRRLSLHPNIVRFLGACCHLAPGPAPPPRALPGPGQARRPRPGPPTGSQAAACPRGRSSQAGARFSATWAARLLGRAPAQRALGLRRRPRPVPVRLAPAVRPALGTHVRGPALARMAQTCGSLP